MIRVLVVPLVADVVADVVQQRGVGERLRGRPRVQPSRSPSASNSTSASRCTCDECGCSTWQRSANSLTERARASPGSAIVGATRAASSSSPSRMP